MSIYQKFIDSAANQHQPQQQQTYANSAETRTMIRQQAANLPIVQSSFTHCSTPISKQQYKRLVEADHHALKQEYMRSHHRQHQVQQQQQQQYCCPSGATSYHQHQQSQQQLHHKPQTPPLDSFFKTDDPILLEWLQAMRFETELECLTSLQARTLAIDEHLAGALGVRNSQVNIDRMREVSNSLLNDIDTLIESLPLKFSSISKFSAKFSELWTILMNETAAQTSSSSTLTSSQNQNNLTIINCTPRKSLVSARTLRPLDKLADQIRNLCIDYVKALYEYQEDHTSALINNDYLESALRKLKELYGKFVEISIRAECANIVRALHYDFTQTSAKINRLSSNSSLHPTRPFESSRPQLPLKWALIALWELTKDSYICRTLTEKWQTTMQVDAGESSVGVQLASGPHPATIPGNSRAPVAKRLDYSTKYDKQDTNHSSSLCNSDYQKLYQICHQQNKMTANQQHDQENNENQHGALSNALRSKQQQPMRQVSTIELLIDIIISQPNKHERLDMMNFIHSQAQHNKLIDVDEWDQSVSAAIYTSNQFKVTALRILNHLCVNEQAVKTILKCFSTPPPTQGQPIPENKIIRSIFECYQTAQEHIYQNETMFHATSVARRGRKRTHHAQQLEDEEYSDYGSRQTGSIQTSSANANDDDCEEGDDIVVKEAIRLLVQLTTSFHRSHQGSDFYTLIGRFSIDSLVKYLTNIIKSTGSREMLFLSLTALANISFITTEPMKQYGTTRIMLEMFRANKHRSKGLELRDQAVTILANTADKNLLDIVSNGGLTFLLSCLESCPTRMANFKQLMDRCRRDPLSGDDGANRLNIDNKPRDRKPIDFSGDLPDVLECACDQQHQSYSTRNDQSPSTSFSMHQQAPSLCLSRLPLSDLAAMERIHQKTAVAFARMSVDPSTTRMVLKYGGIKQLIDLCKFSHKRNHSDTVLIACIAALRKMAKVIESETFRYYNALDLIELDLNQALEIYGTHRDRQLMDIQLPRLFASDV